MRAPPKNDNRINVQQVEVLSDSWYILRKYTFQYRRQDGSQQTLTREVYDRGNGAVILLYDPTRGTVILTRQFRLPAFVNDHPDGMLLEAPAGLLDSDAPADAIRREVEEETGFRMGKVEEVFAAYMSPGSVSERLHFFTTEYRASDRVSAGGGKPGEGEDIEVLEVTLADALAMVEQGQIVDAKTILLLYHAVVKKLMPQVA